MSSTNARIETPPIVDELATESMLDLVQALNGLEVEQYGPVFLVVRGLARGAYAAAKIDESAANQRKV